MAGLYAALTGSLRRSGRTPVIEWTGRAVSGDELLERIDAAAGALAAAGLRVGDRVLVQVEKSLDAVLLYLAVLRQGAMFVPLNTGYRVKEFAYFLGDASPALVVCDPAAAADYAPMTADAGALLLTMGADGGGSFANLVAGNVEPADAPTLRDEDLAAIIYTSGTTGRPKGAMLSQANLLGNAQALQEIWGLSARDVLVHALPLFHIHGLFISLNTALLAGTRVRLLARFDPSLVLDALPGATVFMGVPTYYVRLLADARFDAALAQGLRLCISGSAPLLMETFDAFERTTGKLLLERYGMSECGIITSNRPDDGIRRGSVGPPLPGVELRIVGADGTALPTGGIGSVEVRGPGVFGGYWRLPEKTEAEFRADGYFVTGDLGRLDEDGFLHLVGRAKDMVISGGLNVYPSEVEAAIDALSQIGESAVIGVPHPDFGEAVVAVVCLRPDARCDAETIVRALKDELAGFKIPKAVLFADALPRNAMGKVEKAALRKTHARLFAAVSA